MGIKFRKEGKQTKKKGEIFSSFMTKNVSISEECECCKIQNIAFINECASFVHMDSFVTPQWSCSADNPLSKYHIESWGAVAPWKVSISPGEVLRRQAPTGTVLAQFRLWSYICTQKEDGYILAPELRVTSWPVPSVQEWSLRTGWQEKLSWHSPAAALGFQLCFQGTSLWPDITSQGKTDGHSQPISVRASFGNFTSVFENKHVSSANSK